VNRVALFFFIANGAVVGVTVDAGELALALPTNQMQSNKLQNIPIKYAKILYQTNKSNSMDLK
jgi:hypothetical protein